jgi:hypothetical protein
MPRRRTRKERFIEAFLSKGRLDLNAIRVIEHRPPNAGWALLRRLDDQLAAYGGKLHGKDRVFVYNPVGGGIEADLVVGSDYVSGSGRYEELLLSLAPIYLEMRRAQRRARKLHRASLN